MYARHSRGRERKIERARASEREREREKKREREREKEGERMKEGEREREREREREQAREREREREQGATSLSRREATSGSHSLGMFSDVRAMKSPAHARLLEWTHQQSTHPQVPGHFLPQGRTDGGHLRTYEFSDVRAMQSPALPTHERVRSVRERANDDIPCPRTILGLTNFSLPQQSLGTSHHRVLRMVATDELMISWPLVYSWPLMNL